MELSNLNLNLLVHLDALLAQRSVSGAAEQLISVNRRCLRRCLGCVDISGTICCVGGETGTS
jgi:hypothetical protein